MQAIEAVQDEAAVNKSSSSEEAGPFEAHLILHPVILVSPYIISRWLASDVAYLSGGALGLLSAYEDEGLASETEDERQSQPSRHDQPPPEIRAIIGKLVGFIQVGLPPTAPPCLDVPG